MRSVTDLPGGGTRTVPRPGRTRFLPPPGVVARPWPVEWTEVDFAVGESSRNLRLTGLRTLSDPAIARTRYISASRHLSRIGGLDEGTGTRSKAERSRWLRERLKVRGGELRVFRLAGKKLDVVVNIEAGEGFDEGWARAEEERQHLETFWNRVGGSFETL